MSSPRSFEKKISHARNFVKKLKGFCKKIFLNLKHWEQYPFHKQINENIRNLDLINFGTLETIVVDPTSGFIKIKDE